MKRKIYSILLLLLLVFAVGCNKKEDKAEPTPTTAATAAPTQTPIPENLAKTNLKKLPELFDTLMSYQADAEIDYSNGVGYDITMELSLGQQITELLELDGLDSLSIIGTVDIKEAVAANLSLCLNDSTVLNSHLFADSANLLFNLPNYSANYAATTWEQLMNSLTEEELNTEEGASLTGSTHEVLRTINTVDTPALPSNEELIAAIRKHIVEFTECFLETGEVTTNVSIGTGDYLLSGDKHTVRADINELSAVLESLEAELQPYGEIDLNLDSLKSEGASAFLLDYYISSNGDYAWAAYPDNEAETPLILINTSLGFCLYNLGEDGTENIILFSEKTSEQAGVITIPSSETESEEVAENTINYEFSETSFSMHAMLDSIVISLETSKISDTILYDITIVSDGISMVINETITKERTDISCSLASYGMEYLTLSLTMDTRDYVEIPVPQNTVTLDTWTAELDQTALLTDMVQLMMEYPFLMNFFGGSEDDATENDSGEGLPEENTTESTDFSTMTGYTVDATGCVDFSPLESEVLALGQPSTGMDTMPVTEEQKQELLDYAEKAFETCDTYADTFYWIWGTVEYNDVKSYYTKDYYFSDKNNPDNCITLEFDAVSGEFAYVEIFNENKETALSMANDILAILDVNYTVTAEIAENYTFARNFSFYGYDATQYGDNYYAVSFSVYYPEW